MFRETRTGVLPDLERNSPRSILVVRPGALGDVLLTTPALRALRRAWPESRIAFLVTPSGEAILRGNPNVDEIIVLDKSSLRSQWGSVTLVRKKRFDLVVDFLSNPRTALITLMSGAPRRLGYNVRMRRWAYNIRRVRDEYREGRKVVKYAAQVNNDMLESLGIESSDTQLEFRVSEVAEKKMCDFLNHHSVPTTGLVGICPAGSWPAKTWRLEGFAELADRVIRELGRSVVILWGPGEEKLVQDMVGLMNTRPLVAPETTIDEVGALMKRLALFISNDSGLKHIGVALGTPTVTIFGPTNPKTWNPPLARHRAVYADVDCLFCDKNVCDADTCMKELSVDRVLRAVQETLESPGA